MTQKPVVSIIIVSWNVCGLLKKCIESILQFSEIPCEIIIVDNASSDDTVDIVKKISQPSFGNNITFKVIYNNKNEGFSRANNQGIIQSSGDYILLLNPDTHIGQNTLAQMMGFFKSRHDACIAGCTHKNPDNTIQQSVRANPTLSSQLLILLKIHKIFPHLQPLKKYFKKDFDYLKTQEVQQVAGSFFMFSRKTLEKLGLLDESFFIWFEEVDYCKRAQDAGIKIYYVSDAEIIHHQAQSFDQLYSFTKQKMFNTSLIYYFKKHSSAFSHFILLCFSPISLFISLIITPFLKPDKK